MLTPRAVYKISLDEFDIGNCLLKVKVMAQLLNFAPFTSIQTVIIISALVLDWKL